MSHSSKAQEWNIQELQHTSKKPPALQIITEEREKTQIKGTENIFNIITGDGEKQKRFLSKSKKPKEHQLHSIRIEALTIK